MIRPAAHLVYAFFPAPFGPSARLGAGKGLVVAREGKIVRIRLSATRPPAGAVEDAAALGPILRKLARYFAGRRVTFDERLDLPVRPFTARVMEAVRRIPPGRTRTYAEIARLAGNPRAARAVGNAMMRNPVPLIVPCHRVVASNGLGGFTGGLNRKRALLHLEGWSPRS